MKTVLFILIYLAMTAAATAMMYYLGKFLSRIKMRIWEWGKTK